MRKSNKELKVVEKISKKNKYIILIISIILAIFSFIVLVGVPIIYGGGCASTDPNYALCSILGDLAILGMFIAYGFVIYSLVIAIGIFIKKLKKQYLFAGLLIIFSLCGGLFIRANPIFGILSYLILVFVSLYYIWEK